MTRFHFKDLISRYSVNYDLLVPANGSYDERGLYIPAEPTTEQRRGAIIPYDNNTVISSGGAYAKTDLQLISKTPLPDKLDGVFIMYRGKKYKVTTDTDYSQYGDFYCYQLGWVSAFDKPKQD